MDRELKNIETPNGHKITMKAWLTGRERREIRSVLLSGVDLTGVIDQQKVGGDLLYKMQDKSFEVVITEIDGDKENIVNRILDLKGEDYDFIVEEVNKITGGIPETVKKK